LTISSCASCFEVSAAPPSSLTITWIFLPATVSTGPLQSTGAQITAAIRLYMGQHGDRQAGHFSSGATTRRLLACVIGARAVALDETNAAGPAGILACPTC
jgi:hypothetical protein